MEPRFTIGMTFTSHNPKHKGEWRIDDIYRTYNIRNELIKVFYVCSKDYLGQRLSRYDVTSTEIARSLFNEHGEIPVFT